VQHTLTTCTLGASFILFVADPSAYTCIAFTIFSTLFFVGRIISDTYSQKIKLYDYTQEIVEMKRAINDNAETMLKKHIELELKIEKINLENSLPYKGIEGISGFQR
jgi:hypothetical protein